MKTLLARNHTGHRVSQHHPRAKLSDAEVKEMRTHHAAGIGYARLAKHYRCGISTARDICTYRTRWTP